MDNSPDGKADPNVQVVKFCGEWFVRVVEQSGRSYTRSFEHKDYAVSFAERQTARLGLADFNRI